MEKLELSLGEYRLVVEMKQILFGKIEELTEGLGKIKVEHSSFARFPMKEDETLDEWYDRIAPELLKEETERKEGESNAEFIQRIHTPNLDSHKSIFQVLQLVAKVFGQEEKVTETSFKNCSFPLAQEFLVKLFTKCKLSTRGFGE